MPSKAGGGAKPPVGGPVGSSAGSRGGPKPAAKAAAKQGPAKATAAPKNVAGKAAPAPKTAAAKTAAAKPPVKAAPAKAPAKPSASKAAPKAAAPTKAAAGAPATPATPAAATAGPPLAPPAAKAPAKAAPSKPPARGAAAAAAAASKPPAVTAASLAKAPGTKKTIYDKDALAAIRKRLLEQREELQNQLTAIEESALGLSQSEMSGEVSYDEDYADAGSFTFEREKEFSIANNVTDLRSKIDRALHHIAEGSYGICESCGNPIEGPRLKALPHVTLCLKCKKAEERR